MKIAKAKWKGQPTFNDYELELSWGQLNAIYAALEQHHADPLADELFAELGYYLQNIPGPGEDEEEYKDAKDAEKQAIEGGAEVEGAGGDPELLGQEVDGPPEDMEGAESPVAPEQPVPDEEADSLLERPPTEMAA